MNKKVIGAKIKISFRTYAYGFLILVSFLFYNDLVAQKTKKKKNENISTQTTEPSWVNDKNREGLFSNNFYLKGFSAGTLSGTESLDNLFNRISNLARKELLESIQVDVNNEAVSKIVENKSGLHSMYDVVTKSTSKFDIANIKLEKYFDKNTNIAYAFAYARREDVINFYSNLITIKKTEIQNKIKEGQGYENNNDNQTALKSYAKTLALFKEIKKHQLLLIALGESQELKTQINAIASIEISLNKQINDIIKKEKIFIEAKTNKMFGRYKEALTEPLLVNTYLKKDLSNDNKTIVYNLPIKFIQDTTIFCNTIVDKTGIAKCIVKSIVSKEKNQFIEAKLDLEKYLGIDKEDADNEVFSGLYSFDKINVNILSLRFNVNEENEQKQKVIEPKVKNLIANLGFEIAQDKNKSDLNLKISTIKVQSESTELEGMSFYSVFINCTLSIFDVKTNEEIFSNNYTNLKGISNTEGKALNIAYNKAFESVKKDLDNLYKDKTIK